jgi:dCMP deaminase
MSRPSIDEYFMQIVEATALRATCNRGKSGAVLVNNKNQVIATGYVGAPRGMRHCDDVGHEMVERIETRPVTGQAPKKTEHCVRTVHAELNALLQTARSGGPSTDDATMYCTMFPCYDCAKAIVNAGVARVVAQWDYQASAKSKALFAVAGVAYEIVREGEVLDYEGR